MNNLGGNNQGNNPAQPNNPILPLMRDLDQA